MERISLTQDAADLADQYIAAKVVGPTSRADCQHITMATLAKADVLVSWNFKHIVNLDRIRGYNGINYQLGHSMKEIRTPKEIISYDSPDQPGVVQSLRNIRDQLSREIKDMTFAQERAYLDRLLAEAAAVNEPRPAQSAAA